MAAILRFFRLSTDKGAPASLSCGAEGIFLAGVPLLEKKTEGWTPRPEAELGALLLGAYGEAGHIGLMRAGLWSAARALDQGDIQRAMVASLHLRLPEVGSRGVARLAKVAEFLTKYDPDEPRDWHGKWTTGGAGSGRPNAPADERASPTTPPRPYRDNASSANDNSETGAGDSRLNDNWSGESHPAGGRLILTGGGSGGPGEDDYGINEPPPSEGTMDPTPERLDRPEKVPPGFDTNQDGRIVRKPKLSDGRTWPEAEPDRIIALLKPDPARPHPVIRILVPWDGKGPTLLAQDDTGSFTEPEGYDRIELIGTPQETRTGGASTNHARDAVEEALRLARTHVYSRFWFNRSFSTVTDGGIPSIIRPDLIAEIRPQLGSQYRLRPYESYSPRQRPADRALQMPPDPSVAPLTGRFYKFIRRWLASSLKRLKWR